MSEWSFDSPEGIQDREVGLEAVLKKIRYDLTACQAKLSEALRMVAAMDLPENFGDRVPCPDCGVKVQGQRTLDEHLYVSHGGPTPPHWEVIDAMAADFSEGESASEGSSGGSPAHTADCEQADAA